MLTNFFKILITTSCTVAATLLTTLVFFVADGIIKLSSPLELVLLIIMIPVILFSGVAVSSV